MESIKIGYGDCSGYGSGSGYWEALLASEILLGTKTLRERSAALETHGATLAYWKSEQGGKPANGGSGDARTVGMVEEIPGPLNICTSHALHGTLNPLRWKGDKMWIVALYPPVEKDGDKLGSLKREILAASRY